MTARAERPEDCHSRDRVTRQVALILEAGEQARGVRVVSCGAVGRPGDDSGARREDAQMDPEGCRWSRGHAGQLAASDDAHAGCPSAVHGGNLLPEPP